MEKIKGRPCNVTIKFFNHNNKAGETKTVKARFHCWGFREIKLGQKNKPGFTESVGICELETGGVRLVQPEKITFTDAPKV